MLLHTVSTPAVVGSVIVLILLAALATTCLIRPGVIVRFLQNRYDDSAWFRATLFSNTVFKPWYRHLVRFWGLFIWTFVVVALIGLTSSR